MNWLFFLIWCIIDVSQIFGWNMLLKYVGFTPENPLVGDNLFLTLICFLILVATTIMSYIVASILTDWIRSKVEVSISA